MGESDDPAAFFDGDPAALELYRAVEAAVAGLGPVEVRTSRSQIAFRRRRGFAYVWRPGRWLAKPAARVVLSVALAHRVDSPRFKEIVHPAPKVWMHHLELHGVDDVDEEARAWLREAYRQAA